MGQLTRDHVTRRAFLGTASLAASAAMGPWVRTGHAQSQTIMRAYALR